MGTVWKTWDAWELFNKLSEHDACETFDNISKWDVYEFFNKISRRLHRLEAIFVNG